MAKRRPSCGAQGSSDVSPRFPIGKHVDGTSLASTSPRELLKKRVAAAR
jgi:hypothetical protein